MLCFRVFSIQSDLSYVRRDGEAEGKHKSVPWVAVPRSLYQGWSDNVLCASNTECLFKTRRMYAVDSALQGLQMATPREDYLSFGC